MGAVASWLFARLPHSIGAFAPVASVAAAALSFGAADVVGGSGFLAVYLVGLSVGSTPSRYRRQLVAFHEGLAFLAQVALFVVLGLLVFPSQLPAVAAAGLALALLLMVVFRPVAVWASTAFSDFTSRERLLLGWAGLRGAVPIVLATFVLSSDVPHANTIFNAVFFVVVISAIVQGTTLERVAGRLDLLSLDPAGCRGADRGRPRQQVGADRFRRDPDHAIAGSAVRELGLPRNAIVAVVGRGDESIPPRGSTILPARRPASSCSRRARCARTSTMSSRAGDGACDALVAWSWPDREAGLRRAAVDRQRPIQRRSAGRRCRSGRRRPCRRCRSSPRVPGQVLLVVGLGVVELSRLGELGRDRPSPPGRAPSRSAPSSRGGLLLGVHRPVQRRAVLRADVVPLPHALGRVVALPERLQQLVVGDPGRVLGDEDGFRVPGAA